MGRGRRRGAGGVVALVPLNARFAAFRNARRSAGVLFFACLLLQGCAVVLPQSMELLDAWPPGLPEHAELTEVPFFAQDEYQCGPAALAMALSFVASRVEPRELTAEVYLPARQGSLQIEMLAAARRHGTVSYALDGRLENVFREVAAGTPVIVLQDFGVWPIRIWHYAVVVGFDRRTRSVVMRSGLHQRQVAPWAALEYTWPQHWAMVAMPPARLPATAEPQRYAEAVAAMARVASPQRARLAYEAFLSRWPRTFAAEVGLANALYALHELKASEELLRDALVQQPDSVPVLNNLAMVLGEQGRLEEAFALLSRAEQAPGPYREALRDTRRALQPRGAISP